MADSGPRSAQDQLGPGNCTRITTSRAGDGLSASSPRSANSLAVKIVAANSLETYLEMHFPNKSGAPGQTRTGDPLLRRQTLYPTELRARRH
jgi:hypothetical protein